MEGSQDLRLRCHRRDPSSSDLCSKTCLNLLHNFSKNLFSFPNKSLINDLSDALNVNFYFVSFRKRNLLDDCPFSDERNDCAILSHPPSPRLAEPFLSSLIKSFLKDNEKSIFYT